MTPIQEVKVVPSYTVLSEVRHLLSSHFVPILPVYHGSLKNIVAVAHMKDLLRLNDQQRIIDAAKSPWFVTKETSILQLLHQFRHNNQSIAVILEPSGQAIGILTLDQILAEIFGEEAKTPVKELTQRYIDRTLSGDMSIAEFNEQFSTTLSGHKEATLSDFLLGQFGHLPVEGEKIRLEGLEFTVIEPTIRGIRTFSVKTGS
jgi:putative hemolysin